VTPVGLLRQLTVAAEVGVVDLATDYKNRTEEGQQKFPLRFVKQPAACNRPVRISLRLSMGADEGMLQSSLYSRDRLPYSSGSKLSGVLSNGSIIKPSWEEDSKM
jgi:hypothetical protein